LQLWQRVMAMIWIECDCCKKTIPKHETYAECHVKSLGPGIIPMTHTVHLCEACYGKIRKAVEMVKHDA
jgi:hypothetical protein